MQVQNSIETKLSEALAPEYLTVLNESHMHAVPPNSETHFKVIVVSAMFENKNRLQRHQTVNRLLADELKGPVHALSIQTHTASEWQERNETVLTSPDCMGGSKKER